MKTVIIATKFTGLNHKFVSDFPQGNGFLLIPWFPKKKNNKKLAVMIQ
jgi:hypothetical protein